MTKKKPKIYIVGRANHYANFLFDYEFTKDAIEADFAIFTGGEDVTPSMYGDTPHPTTYSSTSRDSFEMTEYSMLRKMNKKIIGICRGAQFLTAMAGGKIVQHVLNHGTRHDILWGDGGVTQITSTHHQMMNPFKLKPDAFTLLAHATPAKSPIYLCGAAAKHAAMPYEPEVVYYNTENSLAIQGHPEMMSHEDASVVRLNNIIKKWMKDGKIS